MERCLKEMPAKLLEKTGTQAQAENSIIVKLIELCKKLCTESNGGLRTSLEQYIFEKLDTREDIKLMLALLFHKGSTEKEHSKDTGSKISIILDVQNWNPYNYPIASEHTTLQLNRMLLENNHRITENVNESNEEDAFGSHFVNPNEPMPNVKLSGFDITLRSMFSGQPCQLRYGLIEDNSYPISDENRSLIKRSLEWAAHPSRRQITWEKVNKNEIVFVYPSKLPDVSPKFASLFGPASNNNLKSRQARFEKMAEDFSKTFRGLPTEQKPDMIRIFIIQKVDKARSKVVYTQNTTPEQLIKSAEDWSAGCRNLPNLDVGEPVIPFPLQVAGIVNSVWKQNGERADGKTPVRRMKYNQGIELLLSTLAQGAVRNFLHISVEHTSGLFYHLGNLLHGDEMYAGKAPAARLDKKKEVAAQILSVIGLLLYKCEKRKEIYMKELAYLLGQLLHVSDELHALYCNVKRNGEIPPQLAGSALFLTAGEMPYQALSTLSIRMNPYIAWAKQYRFNKDAVKKGEESWRAKWMLGLFEGLANMLYPQLDETIRFGDFEKAQLFIGYMASLPQKQAADKSENIHEDETDGGL